MSIFYNCIHWRVCALACPLDVKECRHFKAEGDEVKHGHWVDVEVEETFCWHGHCSVCGKFNVVSDYCCDCGAKMDNVNEVVE